MKIQIGNHWKKELLEEEVKPLVEKFLSARRWDSLRRRLALRIKIKVSLFLV